MIASINPSTGETVKEFKPLDPTQIEAKLEKAKEAFERYRRRPFIRRVQSMMSAAELLERENP